MGNRIAALVVTYNRRDLLYKNLHLLLSQSKKPDYIIVINNGSIDDTADMVKRDFPSVILHNLPGNFGGSGGFHYGLLSIMGLNVDWVWIMDDDAFPALDALERLSLRLESGNNFNVYCSNLIDEEEEAKDRIGVIENKNAIFVGFCISINMIRRIGLPRGDLFIYWDDIEYCNRIIENGGKIFLVLDSYIIHKDWSRRDRLELRFLNYRLSYNRMATWRSYYLARNAILTMEGHNLSIGILQSKRIIGIIIKTFVFQRDNLDFVYKGIFDGFAKKSGITVEP